VNCVPVGVSLTISFFERVEILDQDTCAATKEDVV
jgi:hypothetical protein